MSIARLVASLEADAARDAAARLAAAEARAGAIRADAEAEAAARRRRFFAEHEPAMRAQVLRQIASAQRTCATATLAARHEILERIFARATEMLATPEVLEDYARDLATRLQTALVHLDDRPAVVRCRPAIADRVRAAIGGRPDLDVDADEEAPTGFVVRTMDGRLEIDDTLDARLERLRPRLASRLVRRLDGAA